MSNLISAMDMEEAERQMQCQPSLDHIQSLQSVGEIEQSDNVTFCSKFVDPSCSSDSDDEANAPAPDMDIPSASENELQNAILHFAKVGNHQQVDACLEQDSSLVTATDDDLYTPLHRAAYNGHLDVMKSLLRHGADANAPTLDGWTPLHSACCWGKVEAAQLLLKAGSRVNARSYQNTTPLHVAANRPENRAVLELLLFTPGVDASIANDSGDTAYQIASRIGRHGFLFQATQPSLAWNLDQLI